MPGLQARLSFVMFCSTCQALRSTLQHTHAYHNGPCMLASEENCRYRVGLCTVTLNLT